jgi:hypothetical protein
LVLYSAFVPEKGVPLLDDVPPGHAALFRQLASESPDNSVVLPYLAYLVWQSGFVQETTEPLQRLVYETWCRVHRVSQPGIGFRHGQSRGTSCDGRREVAGHALDLAPRRGAARGGAHNCDFALSGYK